MKKTTYETPQAELIEVRFEGNLCTSPQGTWDNSIKKGSTWYEGDPNEDFGLE